MPLDLFLSALVSIFVIVDPFGSAAVFAALTKGMVRTEQVRIAVKAVIISASVLFVFSFVGEWLLHHMGISLSAFRIAGGLLLFVTAFGMLMGFHDPNALDSDKSSFKNRSDIAVFPIAIPLLAGPGTMTATIMFTTSAHSIIEYGMVLCAVAIVQAIALASLLGASWLSNMFGPTGNGIIARIMGILLAAMAVQFIADGVTELFHLKELYQSAVPDIMQG